MKVRSLTPAEWVRGRPPSMHTLLPLCLTAGRRRPIMTPQLGFVPPSEENFPLRMTNSPTNNSKLGFSGSFRWFLTRLNIKGTASYGQQPSQPHYAACSLCSRFQDIQTKHQSTENSTNRSKEKSLKWMMTVRGLHFKMLWSTTLVAYFKTELRNTPDVNGWSYTPCVRCSNKDHKMGNTLKYRDSQRGFSQWCHRRTIFGSILVKTFVFLSVKNIAIIWRTFFHYK